MFNIKITITEMEVISHDRQFNDLLYQRIRIESWSLSPKQWDLVPSAFQCHLASLQVFQLQVASMSPSGPGWTWGRGMLLYSFLCKQCSQPDSVMSVFKQRVLFQVLDAEQLGRRQSLSKLKLSALRWSFSKQTTDL